MINTTDPAHYLPHSAPMLLLSQIIDVNDGTLRASVKIKADNPFLQDNHFPCVGAIELVAQAAGVLIGKKAAQATKRAADVEMPDQRNGAVIALKSFELGSLAIAVGNELIVSVSYVGGSDHAAVASGDVFYGEQLVFKGTLLIALFSGLI